MKISPQFNFSAQVLLHSLIFLPLCFFIDYNNWQFVALGIFVAAFLAQYRLVLFTALTLFAWIFDEKHWQQTNYFYKSLASIDATLEFRLFTVLCFVLFVSLVVILAKNLKLNSVLLVFSCFSMVALFVKSKSNQIIGPFIVIAIFWVSQMLWYLAFVLERIKSNKISIFTEIWKIYPFWTRGLIPYFSIDISFDKVCTPTELLDRQKSGIRLALMSCLVYVAYLMVYKMMFLDSRIWWLDWLPSLKLPNILRMRNVTEELPRQLSRWYYLLQLLVDILFFFLAKVAYTTGIIVASLRMMGFRVRRSFYSPFKAEAFHHFIPRTMYYYGEIIKQFFYFPLYRALNGLQNMRLKVFTVSFLSVFLGAFLYHFMRDLNYYFFGENIIKRGLAFVPYYFLLALVTAYSASKFVQYKSDRAVNKIFNSIGILVGYTLIMFWVVVPKYFDTDPGQTVRVFGFLLGFAELPI